MCSIVTHFYMILISSGLCCGFLDINYSPMYKQKKNTNHMICIHIKLKVKLNK